MSTLADPHSFFPRVLPDYGFGGSLNNPASDIVSLFNHGVQSVPLHLCNVLIQGSFEFNK